MPMDSDDRPWGELLLERLPLQAEDILHPNSEEKNEKRRIFLMYTTLEFLASQHLYEAVEGAAVVASGAPRQLTLTWLRSGTMLSLSWIEVEERDRI